MLSGENTNMDNITQSILKGRVVFAAAPGEDCEVSDEDAVTIVETERCGCYDEPITAGIRGRSKWGVWSALSELSIEPSPVSNSSHPRTHAPIAS
jgi:hypothetical protein